MSKLYPAIAALVIIALFVLMALLVTGVIPGLWDILVSPVSQKPISSADIALTLDDLSKEQVEEFIVGVSKKNVSGIVNLLTPSQYLTWTGVTTYYGAGGEKLASSVACYIDGGRSRAEIRAGTGKPRIVIAAGGKLYIDDQNSGYKYTSSLPINYRPEQELGIPSIEDFKSVPQEDVQAVRLERYKLAWDEEIITVYLEFKFSDLNSVEKYWVSLDYGVVVAAQSEIGGEISYSFKTYLISDEKPADNLFNIG